MKKFDLVDFRLKRFNEYLDKLYYAGKLRLNELHSFRKLVAEIEGMINHLKIISLFGILSGFINRDINKLNNELKLMEYNVSLLTTGAF